MTPTQAQIEAAAKAIAELAYSGVKCEQLWNDMAKSALTAAAEVGEPIVTKEIEDAYEVMRNATIERCAQAIEEKIKRLEETWPTDDGRVRFAIEMLRNAATAIRAMKEDH